LDQETAKYIVNYFSNLLTDQERLAIKHTMSTSKLEYSKSVNMERIYKEKGWITQDQNVLALLKDGYDNFEMIAAIRILNEHQSMVFLNKCPKCNKLTRTPQAKQCRHCGNDWHE
jgi:hypothetical protein